MSPSESGLESWADLPAAVPELGTEPPQAAGEQDMGFGLAPLPGGKPPQLVFPELVAFPPNRKTLGGTAYCLKTPQGNLLIDSPPWTLATQDYLRAEGVRWFLLTHRTAMAQVKVIQAELGCEVIVQEQEAYLLPELELRSFGSELAIAQGLTALWTPGHTPGSSCLYWAGQGGVLFTGRHLLPDRQRAIASQASAGIAPLRTSKTFHWPRQLRSCAALMERFRTAPLAHLCPGASIGFLRGDHALDQAAQRLAAIDLERLAQAPIDGLDGRDVPLNAPTQPG